MQNTQLQKNIMRRVYVVYALKRVLSPLALKLYAIAVLAGFGMTYISPANVIQNSAHLATPAAYYQFFASAFANTEGMVQMLLVALIILAAWLVRDIAKTLSYPQVRATLTTQK